MMYSTTLAAILLAGAATAATPPGFQPSSNRDLIVAFGNTLAIGGVDLPRPVVLTQPTVGTAQRLQGNYALLMVDPDLPAPLTGQNLHWMQTGLQSAQTATNVGGRQVFSLAPGATGNTTALAPYLPPSPPARAPLTHRYVFLLVETTNNAAALSALTAAAARPRIPFDASQTLSQAGLPVLAGSWFNVTNTSTSGSPTASGTGAPSGTGALPSSTPPFQGGALMNGPSVVLLSLGAVMGYFLL